MMTRGIFFMVACLIKVTLLKNHNNLNQAMCVSSLLAGSGTILFTTSFHPLILVASMIINSIGFCLSDIYISICIMSEGKDNPKRYLAIGYGMQSFGSIVGPILVSILEFKGMMISGAVLIVLAILIGRQPNPEEEKNDEVEETGKKYLTKGLLIFLCLNMVCYAVQELSIRTWFPSFCIMMKYLKKK